jgi:outer membrane protein assembly factor BamB
VVSAGSRYDRSLVAYDRTSGVPVWWGGKDYSSYSSPIVTALLDARQILIFNKGSLAAHDPATGQVLWQVPWPDRFPNVIQPVPVENDKVFLSSGYGVGAGLVQIFRTEDDGWDTKMLWQNIEMKAKFSPVVKRDEFVYGFDDGILACLNVFSGRQRWKRGRYGHGQIILVDDLLLVQTERGELCLVAADPAEFRELTPPFPVFDRKTWNSPALAGRYAFLRNDREAVCLELPLAE